LTLADGGSLNTLSLRAGSTHATGGTLALTAPTGTNNVNSGLQLGTAAGQAAGFTASGGATVNVTENVHIGDAAGSAGTVTITGAGTVLANTPAGQRDLISVGHNGAGTLNVTAGGSVNSVRLYAATFGGSTGDVVVDGAGSAVTALMLRVGNQGTGSLTVRNGGTVNVTGTTFGQFPFIVGNIGVGTVTVRDGGTVTTIWSFIGYGGDAGLTGNGTVTVTGAGSAVTVGTPTVAGFLGVGMTELGTGRLNVQGGGVVTVHGDAHGAFFDGRGAIHVTDAGSRLTVSGRLTLGGTTTADPGTADLHVGSGGTVVVTGLASLQNAAAINLNAGGVLSLGSLADGPRNGTGVVNLAAGSALTLTDGGTTFSGVITGAGGITKAGAGVQTLAGVSTYTGNTTVSAGTLRLTGSGSIAASPRVTVGTAAGGSAVLDVSGVTGGANFANGGFALAAGQTLSGHGTIVGPVTVTAGSAVAPGASVGTLTVADMTWQAGGRYVFEFSSATPNPGVTNDFINGTGVLNVTATAASPFVIDIQGVNVPGPGTAPVGYTLATFPGGVTGFDPAKFAFPTTGWFSGTPVIALQGNDLVLTFTPVPEPSHVLLLCATAAGVVRCHRQRRRAVSAAPVRLGCLTLVVPWSMRPERKRAVNPRGVVNPRR
jgi:T5SS/PEP-CTERM-associated repeat protein/autotransporter-associated beta strand protein